MKDNNGITLQVGDYLQSTNRESIASMVQCKKIEGDTAHLQMIFSGGCSFAINQDSLNNSDWEIKRSGMSLLQGEKADALANLAITLQRIANLTDDQSIVQLTVDGLAELRELRLGV